ncbi:MAG: adenosine kinase [Desulfobacterales bacterium]|nr:adenosine kinase [Desulfobacterales bacterium]
MKFKEKNKIIGVGSALVDILIHESNSFIEKTGQKKGSMTLVDIDYIEKLLSEVKSSPSYVPGGSACNTSMGISKLGGISSFVGKRGEDKLGNYIEEYLKTNNVTPILFRSKSPTGKVLSVITPDAQRTMFTFLGASSETSPDELTKTCFENAAIVHIEGYLVFNQDLIISALKSAKEAGAFISLDLASFNVVESSRDFLKTIIHDYVDILIANEDEAGVYTGVSDDDAALKKLSEDVEIAILKVGKKGSYISNSNQVIKIEPQLGQDVVDTTGAGDLWASGFLFGLVNGYPLEICGNIGSICGYEVCRTIGASIPDDRWIKIKDAVSQMVK